MLSKFIIPSLLAILISPFREVFIVSRWLVFGIFILYIVVLTIPQMIKYNRLSCFGTVLAIGGAATFLFFLTYAEMFLLKYIVSLGFLFNFLALATNGGRMPVEGYILRQHGVELHNDNPTHCEADNNSHLRFLGDRYVIPFMWKSKAISIGDIFLQLGIFCSVAQIYFF